MAVQVDGLFDGPGADPGERGVSGEDDTVQLRTIETLTLVHGVLERANPYTPGSGGAAVGERMFRLPPGELLAGRLHHQPLHLQVQEQPQQLGDVLHVPPERLTDILG